MSVCPFGHGRVGLGGRTLDPMSIQPTLDAQRVGAAIYDLSRLSPESPPAGGAVVPLGRLYGESAVIWQPRAVSISAVARVAGRRRVVLRQGISVPEANFQVGVQLARLFLSDLGEEVESEAAWRLAHAVAAWIVAPTPSFQEMLRRLDGVDLAALSRRYVITWTSAAMRVAESGGPDAIVTTPTRVYRRGKLLCWVNDGDVRSMAAKPELRSVRKVPIYDEPGRVALFARET
jgi:hypothetical protein